MITDQSGTIMGQRVRGLDRVGLYVPVVQLLTRHPLS